MAAASNNPYGALATDVHNALDELNADETHYEPQHEAEEVFLLPDCVHIFFVKPDGNVSTFSEPSTLRIFKFKDQVGEEEANTFIQVGGWTHPLIPGQSPVLQAGNGAFMFPDVYGSDFDGAAVGIVIADDSVFNIDGEAQEALSQVLSELTAMKKEEPVVDPDLKLGKVGKTLVKSAQLVSKGLEKSAEKATTLIEYAGQKQKAKSEAVEGEVKVNPALKHTAKGVKYATIATVKVSGFVASRVGNLTRNLSEHLAKKMEKPVVKATGAGGNGSKMSGSGSMRNIVDAARGGILAYATVYDGLEKSAKVLGNSVKQETVSVVQHQYGGESAKVYGDSMTAAGNAAMTYMNIQSLGVKGLMKKTAKNTGKNLGKAVIDAHAGKSQQPEQSEPNKQP